MPRLSPFSALRYTEAAGDPSSLIAPPYDVIGEELREELAARNRYNAVRLVLPEGGEERYETAARRIGQWREQGVLAEDHRRGVYVYRQRYERKGRSVERLALFGALDLEPLGEGVLPHEHTHAGPKRDRLALTLATRTQLSPIFLLARDPRGGLLERLEAATSATPGLTATTPDGIEHCLWVVDAPDATESLCALASREPLLIADGHHRYETALEVARQLDVPSAGAVLACIVSAEDPGLVIGATHRTLTDRAGFRAAQILPDIENRFELEPVRISPEEAEHRAAESPDSMFLFVGTGEQAYRLGTRVGEGDAESGVGDRIATVRFDRHVVRGILGTDADSAAHEGRLEYHRDAEAAVRRAGVDGAAFIIPPVSLEEVWEAAAAGVRLPPKSTYFEPKVPSGVLFRRLRVPTAD